MKKYIIFLIILSFTLSGYSQKNKGRERNTPISSVNFKWLDSRTAEIDHNVSIKSVTYIDSLADSVAIDSFFMYIGNVSSFYPIISIDTSGRGSAGIRPWVKVSINDIVLVDTNFYYVYTNDALQASRTVVDTNDVLSMTGQFNKLYKNMIVFKNDTTINHMAVKVEVNDAGRGQGLLANRVVKYILQFILYR